MTDKMTNEIILQTALRQSAVDLNCSADDFALTENKIVISAANAGARKYLKLPFAVNLVSYGNNIVASVREDLRETVEKYLRAYPFVYCFETPNLLVLEHELLPFGVKPCFMAEYFLPDMQSLNRFDCDFDLKLLRRADFENLYLPEWSNALCAARKQNDELAVGAYDGEKLIGLAGCSSDCDSMWQIGVDVLPDFRRRGVASAITSELAFQILELGKVPFYCAAWSNVRSVRNAIRCGFKPAWVELTFLDAKDADKQIILL